MAGAFEPGPASGKAGGVTLPIGDLGDLGRPRRRGRSSWFYPVLGVGLILLSALLLLSALAYDEENEPNGDASDEPGLGTDDLPDTPPTSEPTATTGTLPPFDGWVNPASVGHPYGEEVSGLLTFRGNPTRTFYGTGPVPQEPAILWTFPEGGGMCGESSGQLWCGTGWTGQPAVFERDDRTWVVFGAYDKAVHFLDADTGERLLPDFPVGDIIKGSVTVDPDGFPIVYTGSRDGYFRAIAIDRDEPTELWSWNAEAVQPTLWNDDWDGSALVVDDYLFEGGENSQFHVWKLNRDYDDAGLVTVDPQLIFNAPGWDDQQLADIGDDEVSIENSVAISGNTVYFSNSGGLVQGWDISGLKDAQMPERVFRFWAGEDMDATLVVDDEGNLYGGVEHEKGRPRATEVGQLIKLDPSNPEDPLVWSLADGAPTSGVWATPAIHGDMVYAAFNGGRLVGIDRNTGDIVWEKNLGSQTWQSPVVIDDVLIEGDCEGVLHAYDVSDPTVDPPEIWSIELGGCIESTPAVWDGRIYVGARGGQFYAIGDVGG
jgi:outer membrane protein assembly factor BamB